MARETRALPGVAAAWSRWWRFGPGGPLVQVGTVSHRPFPGLPGEVGMARETRALPGGGRPRGPLVEIRAKRPAGSGRDGVSPSVLWAAGRGGDGPRDSGPIGGGCGAFGEIALPGQLAGPWPACDKPPSLTRPASEVGTDLRAVRPCLTFARAVQPLLALAARSRLDSKHDPRVVMVSCSPSGRRVETPRLAGRNQSIGRAGCGRHAGPPKTARAAGF